jgi:uncharacterized protein YjbI with pentapeptide repeats
LQRNPKSNQKLNVWIHIKERLIYLKIYSVGSFSIKNILKYNKHLQWQEVTIFYLKEATNKEGNFAENILKGANFWKAYLRNANLKEANLKGVNLEESHL